MDNVHFAFSVRENDHRKKFQAKSEPKEPRGQARLLATNKTINPEMESETAEKDRERQGRRLHEEAERVRKRDAPGREIRFRRSIANSDPAFAKKTMITTRMAATPIP